ncbi:ImuA family protein [Anderseniella sp. Alg231-50]|uniref:ImuA family protein n=1 Tax=Anderseniella sp. Alg231-50 TaxID=1922226 RepID=UPI00307C3747
MAAIARTRNADAAKSLVQGLSPGPGDSAHETGASFDIPALDQHLNGGLWTNALHEVRCSLARDFACAAGFALGLAAQFGKRDKRRMLWVIDPAASVDSGLPFPDGLSEHGIDPKAMVFVRPITLQDALWSADQAAKCGDLSAVIFQVKGNPKPFDMTATRRLMLRARESGVLVCVLRQSGAEEASAAATRWHVEIIPSKPGADFEHGPGQARHVQALERNRHGRTGQWTLTWNPENRAFEDGTSEDDTSKTQTTHTVRRIHAPTHRPDRPAEMGQVVDLERAS